MFYTLLKTCLIIAGSKVDLGTAQAVCPKGRCFRLAAVLGPDVLCNAYVELEVAREAPGRGTPTAA